MNSTRPIKNYMTKSPFTIGEDISLSKAIEIMRESQIRHLPVLYAGKLVGVLSDRDIKLALSVHPAAKDLKVGDIMSEDPYSVNLDYPLERVAAEMASHKYGCAVIKNENEETVGIFSAVDALALLGEWLRKN